MAGDVGLQPTLLDTTMWFPCKMMFDVADEASLPRSGYSNLSLSMEFLQLFLRYQFAGKPMVQKRKRGCVLRLNNT